MGNPNDTTRLSGQDASRLQQDARNLATDAANSTASAAHRVVENTRDAAQRAVETTRETAHRAVESTRDGLQRAGECVKDGTSKTLSYVRNNPGKAIGIAAAVGGVLALCLKSSHSRKAQSHKISSTEKAALLAAAVPILKKISSLSQFNHPREVFKRHHR